MQNHYNLVYREEEREMMPLCRAEGIGVIPWSPLARGFLAGNRRRGDYGETLRAKTDDYAQMLYYQDSDFEVVDRVLEIAQRRGVSNAQVALAWVLAQPGVYRSHRRRQQDGPPRRCAGSRKSRKLETSELRELEKPYTPHALGGHV